MPRQLRLDPSEWPELAERVGAAKEGPEDIFASQCRAYRLPPFERQWRFAKAVGRQWRFDFAWPTLKLAVEIDGVVVRKIHGELVVSGRHATIGGIRDDNEKINSAIMLGWSVLRFLQSDVKPRHAIEMTMRVLAERGWNPEVAQ
ncbi:MAG: hypothetical protein ACYDAE_17350 [Steroidobacteraceae bacterium]